MTTSEVAYSTDDLPATAWCWCIALSNTYFYKLRGCHAVFVVHACMHGEPLHASGNMHTMNRPVPIMLEILPIVLSRISQKFCPLFFLSLLIILIKFF